MGNQAVVVLESAPEVGIYLHWNGGPESVLAFLQAAKDRGVRSPGSDPPYCLGRLVQTIGEFFSEDGTYDTSLGVGVLADLDVHGDNGVYYVGDEWEISRREHTHDLTRTVGQLAEHDRKKYNDIVEGLAELTAANRAKKKGA